MMKKRNSVDLPEDLVVEILSGVPTKSLARFRSTSKEWKALVKYERFSKKHSANASRQSLVIMLIDFRVYIMSFDLRAMQDNKVALRRQFTLKDPSSNSSEEDIYNLFHCDGLLLCTTKDDKLVVWNPVSGETKWIEIRPRNSDKENVLFALGYDSKSSCYKIIRVVWFFVGDVVHNEHEIYDFTSNSWSAIRVNTDRFFIPWYWSCGVSVKGYTNWLALGPLGTSKFLLSFDFSTEKFQTHSFPHCLQYSEYALSVVREEQLCLLDVKSLDVWMSSKIEGTGVMSWSKILTAKADYKFSHRTSFVADEQHKVLVCYDKNILHIVAEDRYIQYK